MRPVAPVLAFALAFALTLPTVLAFHADHVPAYATGNAYGPGWAAVRATAGSPLVIDVEGYGRGLLGAGIAILQGDAPRAIFTFVADPTRDGVMIGTHPAPGVDFDYALDSSALLRGPWSMGLTITGWSGDTTVVLFAGGDITSWEWAVRSADATTVRVDSGPGSFILDSRAFEGVAYAHGVGARVSVATSLPFAVEDSLVGVFAPRPPGSGVNFVPTSHGLLTAQTPTGTRVCGCSFYASPPGDYVLSVTGAGTGLETERSEVYFLAADARIPT